MERSRSGTTRSRSNTRRRSRSKSCSPSRGRYRSGTRSRSKSRTKRSCNRRDRSRGSKKGSLSPPPRPKSSTSSRRPSISNLPSTSSMKTKPLKAHEAPKISAELSASIKLEPGVAHQGLASAAATLGTYFKPHVPADINPQEGFERCPICQSYFQDDDDSRNAHLSAHKDRVFVITIPRDVCVVDIEEAFEHLARIGFKKEELQRKVVEHKLIKYPTSLLGFSCKICFKFNGSKKSALEHIKENCKAAGSKEDRALHLLPFCRGCNTKFPSEASLTAHTALGQNACFPSRRTLNKIYDSVAMVALPSPAVVAKKKQEELVKVKQEKQLEIKQEQLAPNIPSAINQFVMDQRNASSGQAQQQAFQHYGPPQPPPVFMPSSEEMRRPLQTPAVPPYHQMHSQMLPPQMMSPIQLPPQPPSQFHYQQNFIAPPLLPPFPNHHQQQQFAPEFQPQQYAPEFQPQVPSPHWSPTQATNQAATKPMKSLSSQLLGQISQKPKPKQRKQMTGNNSEPTQPPILPPPTTTRKERKEGKSKLMMVVPPPPMAPLNLDVLAPIEQTAPLPVFQPQASLKGLAHPEVMSVAEVPAEVVEVTDEVVASPGSPVSPGTIKRRRKANKTKRS